MSFFDGCVSLLQLLFIFSIYPKLMLTFYIHIWEINIGIIIGTLSLDVPYLQHFFRELNFSELTQQPEGDHYGYKKNKKTKIELILRHILRNQIKRNYRKFLGSTSILHKYSNHLRVLKIYSKPFNGSSRFGLSSPNIHPNKASYQIILLPQDSRFSTSLTIELSYSCVEVFILIYNFL